MNKSDARKILSELKGAHAFVPADEEKTVDVISKMIAGKPSLQADPRFLENLRSRLLSEASAPLSKPWQNAWQSFAKFLSVPVALAGIAAIAGSIGILDVKKPASPWDAPKYPVAMTFTDAPETRTDGETAPTSLSATDDALRSPATAESPKPAEKTAPKSTVPDSAPEATSDLRTFSEPATEASDADAARTAPPLALEDVENAISSTSEDSQADAPADDSAESFAGPMAMGTPSELSDSAAWSAMLKTGTPTVSERTYRYAYSGDLPAIPSKMVAYVRVSATWSTESAKESWVVDGYPVYDASGNRRTTDQSTAWKTESAVFVHPSASKAMEWLARSGSSERGSVEVVLESAKVGYLSTVTQAEWARKETLVPAIVFSTDKSVPEGENFATTIVVPLVEIQK